MKKQKVEDISIDEMRMYLELFGKYAPSAYQNMNNEDIKKEFDRLEQK